MILDTAIKARIAGAFYFMAVCAAISGEAFVRGRLAFAIGLLAVACFGVVAVVLIALGGLAWLTDLSIPLTNHLAPYNVVVGFLGEGLPMLWLPMIGVNVRVWNDRAHVA